MMPELSLAGHAGAFPLTAEAKSLILDYLNRARSATAEEPEGDDLVRDIETALGDQLHLNIRDDAEIAAETVEGILTQFGPLEVRGAAAYGHRAPLLCRIVEGKQLSGLCLGIATRADLRVDWVRSIAVILGVFTGGLLAVAYLIALFFAPRMQTVAEYQHALRAKKP